MPVTVVVGGQFGSEGKGKVAYEIARRQGAKVAIRVGGSNSGHTVIDGNGSPRVLRHLPTAAIGSEITSVIGPGAYLDIDVLRAEIEELGLESGRLLIDPNAVVVSKRHKDLEQAAGLVKRIGSTGSGTGAAVSSRVLRDSDLEFARTNEFLRRFYVEPTRRFLRDCLDRGERVLLEGTQGFGLSLLHSEHYPHVTSRDTTAAAFVSEAGLSPFDIDEIVLVLRAFPIRVAGASGPLPMEIDWQTINDESDSPLPIIERTTVTQNVRRVARFDRQIVRAAIEANQPTSIVMNHLDYVDYRCRELNQMTTEALAFVSRVQREIGHRIDYAGFGPKSFVKLQDHETLNAWAVG